MEEEALEALQRLGLTGYEARVYVALEALRSGTASDIADVSEVPRSQVYQTTDALEQQGLVEKQQSNPLTYHTVPVSEVKAQFERQFEQDLDIAFEYIDAIQGMSAGGTEEGPADIWTVQGRENVVARIQHMVADAGERIVYGSDQSLATEDQQLRTELAALGEEEVTVSWLVGADSVRAPSNAESIHVPEQGTGESTAGRILVVDRSAILIGTDPGEKSGPFESETAIWSANTDFAHVLIRLFDGWLSTVAAE